MDPAPPILPAHRAARHRPRTAPRRAWAACRRGPAPRRGPPAARRPERAREATSPMRALAARIVPPRGPPAARPALVVAAVAPARTARASTRKPRAARADRASAGQRPRSPRSADLGRAPVIASCTSTARARMLEPLSGRSKSTATEPRAWAHVEREAREREALPARHLRDRARALGAFDRAISILVDTHPAASY
jgi:hypothetical protein